MKISRNLNLKLGIETASLSQTLRGVGHYTAALIDALKGYNPVCFHPPNATDLFFPKLPHHHFFTPPKVPFANSLLASCRHSCFNQVDVMLFPDPKIIYGKKPKVPFILTIHDVMPLKFPQFFPKKSTFLMRHFLSRYLKQAAAITTVSRQTKMDLTAIFPFVENKVHVIPCALFQYTPLPLQREKDPFLLYIGSFEPRKNLKGIIQAFAKLKEKGYPHTLVLAGKEEKGQLIPHKLIEELNLQDQIVCKGYVTPSEKQALLQKSACLVWPSFYEGFGLPLLEAMAQGTPIVTSNIPILHEVCGKVATYVDPHCSTSICQGIEQALFSPFPEEGLKRAELFSLQKLEKNYIDLIETLIK